MSKEKRQDGSVEEPREQPPDAGDNVTEQASERSDGRQSEASEQPQAANEPAEGRAAALDALQRERDELESKLLRAMADYQNYARRAEQNVVAAREQQLMAVAKSLITVLDHFDRALEVDPEKTSTRDLLKGVTIVRDELMRALQSFGIERLDVQSGEPFDPNRHEALMRQPSEEVESNHVTSQFQPGYQLKDKTIRPAQVSVAE